MFYCIQILIAGVEGNIDYMSSWGTKYCPTRRKGQYIVPRGLILLMLPEKWKHSQNLFFYMKKQTKNEENFENKLPLFSQLNIEFMSSILHPVYLIKITLALNGLWWYSTMSTTRGYYRYDSYVLTFYSSVVLVYVLLK